MSRSAARRKVLLVSYLFPPVGGAGVQRMLKVARYLPEFGWDPFILTVKPINYYVYDESLLNELPAGLPIVRTESLDPLRLTAFLRPARSAGSSAVERNAHFMEGSPGIRLYRAIRRWWAFPDAQVGWIPFAYRAGCATIAQQGIDAIVASIGPLSSAVVAWLLSRRTRVPYVLDFRDGWTDDPYATHATRLHLQGHRWLEQKTVAASSAVTVYGQTLADPLARRYPALAPRITVLPNGFDPADFDERANTDVMTVSRDGVRRIAYVGSLYAYYEQNLLALIGALKQLPAATRDRLRIDFVGQAYERAQQLVADAALTDTIGFRGYVSHGKALEALRSADAGLIFCRPGDLITVTGKVFEYIRAGRPILACAEREGECAAVLRAAGNDRWVVPPLDSARIAQAIAGLAAEGWPRPAPADIGQFSRRTTTERFAAILDTVADQAHSMVVQ